MRLWKMTVITALVATVAGCSTMRSQPEGIAALEKKPLYRFTELEVGAYLTHLQDTMPDLRDRVVHLGRKNIGQPYRIYLLGEAPFEFYDADPMYKLTHSDCVVFAEHTYAMAFSSSWQEFFPLLQRIRYRNGEISTVTRNHYTEAQWNLSNDWLVEDITLDMAGSDAVEFEMNIDLAKFLMKSWGLETAIEPYTHYDAYIPHDLVEDVGHMLLPGDFVNVVRGNSPTEVWVGHVGLVTRGPNGELHLLHSTSPRVVEEPLEAYIQRSLQRAAKNPDRPSLRGFKFLRLREDAMERLVEIDGPLAPRIGPLRSEHILAVHPVKPR